MNKPIFVPFTSPMIPEDEIQEVVKVLRSGWIGTGPKVQEFEGKMAKYLGASHFLAVNSGTAALHLSLLASGIGRGDEVITTPMTFAATSNVIHHVGAKPVFADIKKDDWNIDPEQIRKKVTKRTRAIIPVHLGGMPCDMDEINEIAEENNLEVFEDGAHCIGSKYEGKRIGNSANLVSFSFYPSKIITTIEGGGIAFNDLDDKDWTLEYISAMRLHGQSSSGYKIGTASGYRIILPGYKYNLVDVHAAIGLKQLEKIDSFIEKRRQLALFYTLALQDVKGIQLPMPSSRKPNKDRVWYLFSILVKHRDKVIEQLNKCGIGTGIHYKAVHLEPFYGGKLGQFPNCEYVSQRTLSLPMTPRVSQEQAEYVVKSLKEIVR